MHFFNFSGIHCFTYRFTKFCSYFIEFWHDNFLSYFTISILYAHPIFIRRRIAKGFIFSGDLFDALIDSAVCLITDFLRDFLQIISLHPHFKDLLIGFCQSGFELFNRQIACDFLFNGIIVCKLNTLYTITDNR